MELNFNDAKSVRPGHLERCLCYDKFLKGYRCYVYDDISKYWCTQATTEHDPDGENHIVDYADYQVTEWASLSNANKPSLPSNLDEAAELFNREDAARMWDYEGKTEGEIVESAFKAGAEWQLDKDSKKHYFIQLKNIKDAWQELKKSNPEIESKSAVCFYRGAEWMAEQGVSVKGLLYGGSLGIPDIPEEFYTDKVEEVIVQIRKK